MSTLVIIGEIVCYNSFVSSGCVSHSDMNDCRLEVLGSPSISFRGSSSFMKSMILNRVYVLSVLIFAYAKSEDDS